MGRDLEIDICLNRNKNHRLTEEATKADFCAELEQALAVIKESTND